MKHVGGALHYMLLLAVMLLPLELYPLTFPEDESDGARGEGAMANRYALWSKNLIEDGYWAEALAALERAADFIDVSSDISYLLAMARSHENKDRGSVLGALEKALAVDRWNLFYEEDARLLKIENLIALRAYHDALTELSKVSKGPREAELTLKAIFALRPLEFRGAMKGTLARYPRETGLARIYFDFLKNEDARGHNPVKEDIELLELLIRRLPLLLPDDPELAWIAAPFMRDTAEAKRLVSAYRALHKPVPASLPAALKLGVIDEGIAIEELFSGSGILDLALLGEIWDLLRHGEAKEVFKRNLSDYTGVIKGDSSRDGIPEACAEYYRGMLRLYTYDADQDASPDLTIHFEAGDPVRALVRIGDRERALVKWERYPSVLETELAGVRYIPRPLDFYFSPVRFVELWGSGVLFPEWEPLTPSLTQRVLVLQCFRLERPSLEFNGGVEVVELEQGIPIRAREYVEGLMVSETDFLRGRPQLQRVDLDFDGRMDTFRYFKRNYRVIELEDLWNYDREFDRTITVHDWDG